MLEVLNPWLGSFKFNARKLPAHSHSALSTSEPSDKTETEGYPCSELLFERFHLNRHLLARKEARVIIGQAPAVLDSVADLRAGFSVP